MKFGDVSSNTLQDLRGKSSLNSLNSLAKMFAFGWGDMELFLLRICTLKSWF